MNVTVRTVAGATALTAPFTRAQMIEIAADALRAHGETLFNTIRDVERTAPDDLAKVATAGTIFAPVVVALNAHGVPTEGKVGGVMCVLELTQHEVHVIACWCHEMSDTMMARVGAARFDQLIARAPVRRILAVGQTPRVVGSLPAVKNRGSITNF